MGSPDRAVYRSGGVVSGSVGIVTVLGFLVVSLIEDDAARPWIYPAGLAVALLIWAMLLRPAVVVDGDGVLLRNSFSDVRIPFVRIVSVGVRQFTVVEVAEDDGSTRRVSCNGLGRSRRRIVLDGSSERRAEQLSLGALVEDRISRRAREVRAREDVAGAPPVERRWVVPALVGLGVLAALAGLLAALG